jgi:hypothetical protein
MVKKIKDEDEKKSRISPRNLCMWSHLSFSRQQEQHLTLDSSFSYTFAFFDKRESNIDKMCNLVIFYIIDYIEQIMYGAKIYEKVPLLSFHLHAILACFWIGMNPL